MFGVSIPWFVISQVFGVMILIVIFITFQQKNKERLLLWSIFMMVLFFLMWAALDQWTIAAISGVGAVRNVAFYWLKKNQDRVSRGMSIAILVVFIAFTVTVGFLTRSEWFDLVIIISSSFFVIALWQNNPHILRFIGFINGGIFLAVNILLLNIMGMLIELSFITSIIVFYIRYYRRKMAFGHSL